MILVQNITERKLADIALRESEMFYRGIFETFFDGLIILVDGIIVDVNPAELILFALRHGLMPSVLKK